MGINESPNIMAGSLRRVWRNAGVPTDGVAGTLYGVAEKGDLLIDTTNATLYQNTNTQASPTWTEKAASGAAIGIVGDMAAAGTGTANVLGVGTTTAAIDHVHALGDHDHSGATVGGDLGDVSIGAETLTESAAPAGTACYVARDNTGDLNINALAGKQIELRIAGTNVAVLTGAGLDITGNLTVTGTFGVTGPWDIGDTLTCDELILDTDGAAPAGTNAYAVSDNTGDLTVNALTGKQVHVAINGTDEYDFSATILDMNGNALDNCGYVILNTATNPAGTEVFVSHDNAGDLTVNAKTGKTVNVAIAGTDEYTFSAAALAMTSNNLIFTSGHIELGATGYVIGTGTVASAGIVRVANDTYVASARNAADAADVDLIKADASDLIAFGANLAALTMGATLTLAAQQISLSTGNITFSGAGYIAMGVDPASAGYIRLLNTGVIAWRNAANAADIDGITVNAADDVQIGADLQMGDNVIYGSAAAHSADTADGSLYLHSTLHATKGFVCIPATHLGLVIGSDGSVDRGTSVGTNSISLFNGTAPSGTLVNGATFYCEGGEMKVLDAAGNSTTLSPHTEDGDFVIHSYSAVKGKTVTIHLEKLVNALASNPELKKFVTIGKGHVKTPGKV
ncbi:MAG: hypothetical protein Q8O55_11450 [Dehalococcoidales bacterium]|nr:hypothetical protein [Dehalococcoidales bacterium]